LGTAMQQPVPERFSQLEQQRPERRLAQERRLV
jgi:hypothetical protein